MTVKGKGLLEIPVIKSSLCGLGHIAGGKWLELLKEIAPQVKWVPVLGDPTLTARVGQFAVIQSVAPSIGMEVTAISLRGRSQDIRQADPRGVTTPRFGIV
jgi:hypothetical protein